MNIKDVVQTTVFICCLVMIPVLGLAYYLYTQSGLEHSEVLDKSFGVMTGVFSGAATLAAAYIASLLFNDWRDQHRANFYEKFYYDFRERAFNLHQSYQPIRKILLNVMDLDVDPPMDSRLLKEYNTLRSNFLIEANYIIKILDDLLYIMKKDDDKSFDLFLTYRKGVLEVIAFFEVNDIFGNDYHIRNYLIEKNIKNREIEAGILNLNLLFSLDLLDVIFKKIKQQL